ncbi:MAG: alanine--tRNA ligase [Candidatus Velthaea sp.]
MTSQELRAAFIDFFGKHGHKHVASASLIPDAMSSTLFTIAGMEPFVPNFLGEVPPPAPRAVSVQRCLRVAGAKSDIENVGRTGRHGTFLEMLGNFSFGDYYKKDAIRWAWEFLTEVMKLDRNRLYVTVHVSDDEAQNLWETEIGLAPDRITRWDEDNFWTMGPTGPCGPCSEIFYDTGAEYASGPADTGPNLGDRYVEIWNLVFQQYNRGADGALTELPSKNIDTGAGFERMLAVANGKASMYETDLFTDVIAAQPAVGATTLAPAEQLVRRNIIADHARAVTFLVADGVYPSNTDRGYVLRFLIRRAIRNGRLLGYPKEFLPQLAGAVVNSLKSGYPFLESRLADVQNALRMEEQNFVRTLDRGSELLDTLIADAIGDCTMLLTGEDVFTLHDTYGFPWELTREIAGERGVAVDSDGFTKRMEVQRERARADAKSKRAVVNVAEAPALRSVFEGYGGLEARGTVVGILVNGAPADRLDAGAEGTLLLDRTSFYAEKGGQIGDHGSIVGPAGSFEVSDTQFIGEAIAHYGRVVSGSFASGEAVRTSVDPQWREEIRRHHTSAHLLQHALRELIGPDVMQAGSWVGIDRMRFDFRSPVGALTPTQKRAVVQRVNQLIRDDYHLETQELPIDEAHKSGAISMAGEKYGELVRVVKAGPAVEFCGGTHAHTTGELGMFVILSESSIGSGVRRIEAIVSKAAEAYVERQQDVIAELAETLSAKPDDLVERVGRLQNDVRDLQKSLGEIKARLASADAQSYVEGAERINGTTLVAALVHEANAESLRTLGNAIRSRLRAGGVIALVGVESGSVALFASASDDAVKAGVHAGNLVKAAAPLVGGKGGGAPAQAQGGGKDVSGAEAALAAMRAAIG